MREVGDALEEICDRVRWSSYSEVKYELNHGSAASACLAECKRSMKLSPYRFDVGRILRLATRPNFRFDTFMGAGPPDDAQFSDTGLMQIPSAVPVDVCDAAVHEHQQFESFLAQQKCTFRDATGRNYRLANFHLRSPSALKIGVNDIFHRRASAFFRRRSAVYTSLFYKHGSQQKAHIDTPYFWTRPFNLYVGVWVALEDVLDTAGPLFYYPGSHRLFANEAALREVYARAGGDVQVMFDLIRTEVERSIAPVRVLLKKGDAVIWHPGIMHGGSPSTDPNATRYSVVFHFAPVGVNVRDDVFPENFANLPTYGLRTMNGQYYCRGALPMSMI